jgi:hypothetical protein
MPAEPSGALLALAGGRLDQLAFHTHGHQYIDTYSRSATAVVVGGSPTLTGCSLVPGLDW